MRLSPLHDRTRTLGARFGEAAGWRIPDIYEGAEEEATRARAGVVLADESARGRLLLQSDGIARLLAQLLDPAELPPGAGQRLAGAGADGGGWVYRLRPDILFISTPPGAEADLATQLQTLAGAGLTAVTDVTDGRAEIRVLGPASRLLLSKVCGLDFSDEAFSDGEAAQTSVAKTNMLVLRRDLGSLPAYSLIGRRSLGDYVWQVLAEAGTEWQVRPIGSAGLDLLSGD